MEIIIFLTNKFNNPNNKTLMNKAFLNALIIQLAKNNLQNHNVWLIFKVLKRLLKDNFQFNPLRIIANISPP